MRPYRCYFLNAQGGIAGCQVLVCADDRELSERVPELLARRPGHNGVEVWQRCRRLGLHTADPQHA